MTTPDLAAALAIAETRWNATAFAIPMVEGADYPTHLFVRPPIVEAIGIVHARSITTRLTGSPGLECSAALWRRARFMATALAFVILVAAPDGTFFATIRDFDNDGRPFKRNGMDHVLVPLTAFKELRHDGARTGPGIRAT